MTSPLTQQIHERFARFRQHYAHSSLTAVLESGPAVNAAGATEYVVRATISLNGQPLVSSLAAAPSIEEAEDLARLRNLALAEAVVGASTVSTSIATPPPATMAAQSSIAPNIAPVITAPATGNYDYSGDDGLGETMINLGPMAEVGETDSPKASPKTKAKPKPKPKGKKSKGQASAETPSTPSETAPVSEATAPETSTATEAPIEEAPAQEFVADWSEDLAQISVELKRLNWDSKQEQEYLQRTFNKSSRDDIIDHGELMEYLGYLQALPSNFEEKSEAEDDSPIADAGLSVDEADLAPKSVSELMASAGLKSGAEIPAPPPAIAPTVTEADMPDAAAEASDSPADDIIVREPEPEIEIADDGPDEDPLAEDPAIVASQPTAESQAPAEGLTRSEMMDETARLCKQLGWKNRQGSDFLKATYNKATRKDLTDAEMMDFLEQLRSLSTTEALPY